MSRHVRAVLLALAVPLGASPVGAAPAPTGKKDATLPVPADALVVVQVNGVGGVRDRLTKLVEAAAPDLAGAFKQTVSDALDKALDGRDLSAVTPDGRAYLVVRGFEPDGDRPPVALLLPVADYKTFREKALTDDERKSFEQGKGGVDTIESRRGEVFLVSLRGNYVAVTPHRETAEALAKKPDGLTAAALGDRVGGAFLGSDVSVYVNLDRVSDQYGDRIRQFHQLLHGLLGQGGMGLVPGLDKRQAEMALLFYDGMFQAVQDGRGFAVGVEFRPDGLAVRGEVTFADGTESAKLLGGEKPTALEPIGKLPKGQAIYSGARYGPGTARLMRALNREFAAGEDDEKATAAIDAYTDLFTAAAADGWYSAGHPPQSAIQVLTPKDPRKLVDAHLRVLRTIPDVGVYQNVPLKEKPSYKEAAEKHAGFTFHRVRLSLDFEAAVAAVPDANLKEAITASVKRLVSESPTYWVGTDGERYVQVTAANWDAARKLLDASLADKDAAGSSPAFQSTRKQLPAEATQLMLVDAAEFVATFGGYARSIIEAMPGFPGGVEIPEPRKPAGQAAVYGGVALVAAPGSLGFTAYVPAGAVKAGRSVFDRADR